MAIHLGWQASHDGTLVAHWRATAPLTTPRQLTHVIVPDSDGVTGRIIAPAAIATRLQRLNQTASTRDLTLDSIRRKLTDWLREHGPVPQPNRPDEQLTADAVVQWRSPARFAALALDWRDSGTEMAAQLEAWRAAIDCAGNSRATGAREPAATAMTYGAKSPHTLASQCSRIVDDTNVADVTRGALGAQRAPHRPATRDRPPP